MSSTPRPAGGIRAQAVKASVPVSFICTAPQATRVCVVGDFNAWNPDANPLELSYDGSWKGSIGIRHGHHRYAFWVDGVLQVDPRGQGISRNDKGERVSLLAVS
jgi:1,4-alpha-glucan branching enzyme